jgi:hypothetical protein
LALQKHSSDVLADELDLWGAYLDTRLQAERIHLNGNFSVMWLTGYSKQFDDWVAHSRGEIAEEPSIRLNIPDEIRWVLRELRARNDYAARWIAFAILDMPDAL